jgi:hypothetical protein
MSKKIRNHKMFVKFFLLKRFFNPWLPRTKQRDKIQRSRKETCESHSKREAPLSDSCSLKMRICLSICPSLNKVESESESESLRSMSLSLSLSRCGAYPGYRYP